MKIRRGIRRWGMLSAGLLLGSILSACGGESTDPEVKTLDELQNAKGLTITETGTGKVRLSWVGTNGETDFTGYNIYGAKMTADLKSALTAAKVNEGDALQLVDEVGEPRAAAKAVLQLMSYNGSDFESAATANPTDEDVQFQFYPVYTTKDVFPTCLPTAATGSDIACQALTAEGTERTFFGTTYYDIEGLKAGSEYCFLVLSTLDSGKTVAMTSTELACTTPTVHAASFTATVAGAAQKIDMKATRTACTESTCVVAVAAYERNDNKAFCANDDATIDLMCLEVVSGRPGLTGGKYVSINDLGFYGEGFNDVAFPKDLPALTGFNSADTTIAYDNGYAISGQTLPIVEDHIYLVASRKADDASAFYYDLFYAKSVSSNGEVTFEARIAK